MIIELQPHSDKPIYEQLILEIKRGIVMGQLQPGEHLPSVRTLAADIGINMHTVNKVYKYLQKEQILLKQKNGFIVNTVRELTPTLEVKNIIKQQIYELMLEKELYQISDEEIFKMMKSIEKDFKQ